MSLESLLREWAELEPERCRRSPYALRALGGASEFQVMDPALREWVHTFIADQPRPVVQVAVQEAIEARGWSYSLSSFVQTDASFARVATVWPNRRQLGSHSEGDSSSPAVALLSAHLAALKAEKETT